MDISTLEARDGRLGRGSHAPVATASEIEAACALSEFKTGCYGGVADISDEFEHKASIDPVSAKAAKVDLQGVNSTASANAPDNSSRRHTKWQPNSPPPATTATFVFVEPPAMSTEMIPFRRPAGIILTKTSFKPYKVFQVRITLDFPGQECNYHISRPPAGCKPRYEITLILSSRGDSIGAMDRKTFPGGYDWQRGVVVDCGGLSGLWICEFPQTIHGSVEAVEAMKDDGVVGVMVEEGDYGEY